jgi:hypothetical protein
MSHRYDTLGIFECILYSDMIHVEMETVPIEVP